MPQLARLAFESCCNYAAASLAPLSRLSGSLTRLDLLDVSSVPAALTSLTRLRHLHCDLGCEAGGAFHTSLQHLPQLTFLVSSLAWSMHWYVMHAGICLSSSAPQCV